MKSINWKSTKLSSQILLFFKITLTFLIFGNAIYYLVFFNIRNLSELDLSYGAGFINKSFFMIAAIFSFVSVIILIFYVYIKICYFIKQKQFSLINIIFFSIFILLLFFITISLVTFLCYYLYSFAFEIGVNANNIITHKKITSSLALATNVLFIISGVFIFIFLVQILISYLFVLSSKNQKFYLVFKNSTHFFIKDLKIKTILSLILNYVSLFLLGVFFILNANLTGPISSTEFIKNDLLTPLIISLVYLLFIWIKNIILVIKMKF